MLFEVEHTLLHDFSFLTGLAFFELRGIGEVGIFVYTITYCMYMNCMILKYLIVIFVVKFLTQKSILINLF